MSRFTAVFLLLLLLLISCSSSRATRPAPLAWKNTSPENQHPGDETGRPEAVDHEDCEAGGDEECLMRRTLAAHLDYIYTQKHQP
ncbi:phytosulfokines-like [Diospyros lotus]|uniref:phytosulfokines-like n=1 Tax=Diospyros lotus TaxID=55363 RepID=UPI0022509831|nr:phytosulfokines-like [Diospyros lotus]